MSTSRRSTLVAGDIVWICPACNGTMESPLSPTWACQECDGTGRVSWEWEANKPADFAWYGRNGWVDDPYYRLARGVDGVTLWVMPTTTGHRLKILGSGWEMLNPTRGQVLRLVAALKGEAYPC